jgi:hypothetical protein
MWAKMQASMLSAFSPAATPPGADKPGKADTGKRRG